MTQLLLPDFVQHPLPEKALHLCETLNAPLRLVAHLTLVHDVACQIVTAFPQLFPGAVFDPNLVLFGAATHDLGKARFPQELEQSGELHEDHGPDLLISLGVAPELARFARTHAAWKQENTRSTLLFEDLLVGLADNWWKGNRPPELEQAILNHLETQTQTAAWELFIRLDELAQTITHPAQERLDWMRSFPVQPPIPNSK
ncbi:MAG: phosphohydrolase [Acidobacteria bacterium]|nr:phosphohydrolase [Acidobacteriota bacterium]